MASQLLTINIPAKRSQKVRIEMDVEQFERLAADLGLFQKEFLESIARAENEIAAGETRRLRSLHDLSRSS